ncbi:TraB/GumN family protein [Flavisolibacter nicotianae]|uniref:TraB/GumN family protein n=1 Tax=Flavisolibacter nicotianae TaxID=2364882 RepID=UPI000EB1F5EA|nr:TraB/GumN family protein [Flavisolibacter nicotianae]
MKRTLWLTALIVFAGLFASGQNGKAPGPAALSNTLLWRISGKGLQKPSYLFGTMHLLCADDIALSDSLKMAISRADNVYLELDMNNMFEMLGAMQHMSMKGDTTLADLLTQEEYKKVKAYFHENASMLPFEMLQTYKPLLTASMVAEQQSTACDHMISMEQLIMEEAKSSDVAIKGLETMDFQLEIFDKIPYKLQAKQLYQVINHINDKGGEDEMQILTNAYRRQQLEKLEEITKKEDMGMSSFIDLLLYNRNANWAKKLHQLMQDKSLVVAVGAGHLPGAKGVINLLRTAGYKVEPVANEMIRKKVKEI